MAEEPTAEILRNAEMAFEDGRYVDARKMLAPLAKERNGAAIRLLCSHFDAGTSEEEMNRVYAEGMCEAADCGDLQALHIVGSFYDLGEHVETNKEKASNIFKQAADRGHAHSMWIHACELLSGKGLFEQEQAKGLEYLNLSIVNGSAEGCITKAKILREGAFGLTIDLTESDRLRKLAKEYDETTYDLYAYNCIMTFASVTGTLRRDAARILYAKC